MFPSAHNMLLFLQEIYSDDSSSWKKNKECTWGTADVPSSELPVEAPAKVKTDKASVKAQGALVDKL